MTWAEDIRCELCGAEAGERCREPSNSYAHKPHRVRILQSLVGLKSAAAAARVEQILREREADGGNQPSYTLPKKS